MFDSREDAGRRLAQKLFSYKEKKNTVVVGIPRGGVVVASVIAKKLNLPLTVAIVKKISAPNNPELAIGAVGPNKIVYWDKKLCKSLHLTKQHRDKSLQAAYQLVKKRESFLKAGTEQMVKGKTVLLVDDGIATGATVHAAKLLLAQQGARSVILVIPVAASDMLESLQKVFEYIVVLETPEQFYSVGQFYKSFPQVSDREVVLLLSSREPGLRAKA